MWTWLYIVANLFALPGLGTFLAGRRVAGAAQMIMAATGFVLTMFWFATFVLEWIREREFPYDGGAQFHWGLIGAGTFACAWLWGLVSGLQIRRAARTKNP